MTFNKLYALICDPLTKKRRRRVWLIDDYKEGGHELENREVAIKLEGSDLSTVLSPLCPLIA